MITPASAIREFAKSRKIDSTRWTVTEAGKVLTVRDDADHTHVVTTDDTYAGLVQLAGQLGFEDLD